MATVLNAGSGNKAQSIETWRAVRAREWQRIGGKLPPEDQDHLQLCDHALAEGFLRGDFDPLPLKSRKFNHRTERYED